MDSNHGIANLNKLHTVASGQNIRRLLRAERKFSPPVFKGYPGKLITGITQPVGIGSPGYRTQALTIFTIATVYIL